MEVAGPQNNDSGLLQKKLEMAEREKNTFKQMLENERLRHKRELHKKGRHEAKGLKVPVKVHGTEYYVHPVVHAYMSDLYTENRKLRAFEKANRFVRGIK